MENIKSLADQIREELKNPEAAKKDKQEEVKTNKKTKSKNTQFELLTLLQAYDSTANKSMVHVRFDEKTAALMNQFKMATRVDISKFVAYVVQQFIANEPQFKQIIKNFIQNSDL